MSIAIPLCGKNDIIDYLFHLLKFPIKNDPYSISSATTA